LNPTIGGSSVAGISQMFGCALVAFPANNKESIKTTAKIYFAP